MMRGGRRDLRAGRLQQGTRGRRLAPTPARPERVELFVGNPLRFFVRKVVRILRAQLPEDLACSADVEAEGLLDDLLRLPPGARSPRSRPSAKAASIETAALDFPMSTHSRPRHGRAREGSSTAVDVGFEFIRVRTKAQVIRQWAPSQPLWIAIVDRLHAAECRRRLRQFPNTGSNCLRSGPCRKEFEPRRNSRSRSAFIGKSPAARYQRIAGLVKRLHELGMSNRAIGRELGVHHTDVAKALALGRGCDTVGIAPPRP